MGDGYKNHWKKIYRGCKARFCLGFVLAAYFTTIFGPHIPWSKTEESLFAVAESTNYACVMEISSRRILYAQNADIRLPMASTTKILTAATVIDVCEDLSQTVKIPAQAVGIEGSSVYLKEGEEYTVKDLLYGLMLRSGNDAAVALALTVGKSQTRFCGMMNETAQKAGALHSRFENPHGLPCENHYTTATDLSLITCYAMQNETFCEIVSTKYYEPRHWQNKNKLLTSYDGAIGVKTGYTKEAGRCLVSAAQRQGMRLVCTLLNYPDTYGLSEQLLDDAFATYQYTKIISVGDEFPIELDGKIIKARLKDDFYYPLSEGEQEHLSQEIVGYNRVKKDGSVGEITIRLAKRLIFSEKLYKL